LAPPLLLGILNAFVRPALLILSVPLIPSDADFIPVVNGLLLWFVPQHRAWLSRR